MKNLIEEEIQSIQPVKHTNPRASIPTVLDIIAYKTPRSWASKDSEEDFVSSDEEEVTSEEKRLTLDKNVVPMELNNEEKDGDKLVVNKGLKRNLEEGEAKGKKENLK